MCLYVESIDLFQTIDVEFDLILHYRICGYKGYKKCIKIMRIKAHSKVSYHATMHAVKRREGVTPEVSLGTRMGWFTISMIILSIHICCYYVSFAFFVASE